MKKVVRMLGLCALVALAVTSCKKEEKPTELTFTASINQPVSDSRTHIGVDNMLVWDANNTIKVFNANGEEGDFTTTDQDVVDATFTGTLTPTAPYTAFYPNAAVNGNAVTLVLNATQNYVANNFGNDTYPMAAASTVNGNDVNFNFHSPASVMRLILKSNNACTVGSIIVTGGANDKLAGNLVYPNFNDPVECSIESATNSVTLNCGNGVQLAADEATAFNIVLLSGTLSAGTTVVVKDINGNTIKTLTTSVANNFVAETIYTMPIQEISYELPNVTTTAATGVTHEVATINGTYTFPAGAAVTACGFYWGTDQAAVANGTATKVTTALGTPMSHNLMGLSASTTYYFKAWAVNASGESCGAVLNFTTDPEPVVVVVPSVQTIGHSITGTSATLSGKLVNDGNEACTVGIQFCERGDFTGSTLQNLAVSGTHNSVYDFNKSKGSLRFNVTYWYRAYATNSAGTVYGDPMSFKIEWVGHFLVDDVNMKFVYFSTGLLWWDDDEGEFAFEDDQYSFHLWMRGSDNPNGASGTDVNASFSQFCWSHEFNDYGKNNTPNQTGHFFDEWGENVIRMSNSTDHYPANYWRTLTYPEWECIMRHHEVVVRERNGMNYVILLPYQMTANQANSYNNQELSDMGAAFFPMCGNAVDYTPSSSATWGWNSQLCLWTSSMKYDNGWDYGSAGAVWIYSDGSMVAGNYSNAYMHRMQVRLAKDEE